MIYFIDEEINQVSPYADELRLLGYSVKQIGNADDGLNAILAATDVELVIVDVMMSTQSKELSVFLASNTQNFLSTGIELLEKVATSKEQGMRLDFFPSKTVVFSMANQQPLVDKITLFCNNHKVSFLKKKEFPDPYDFGIAINNILKKNFKP